MSSEMNISENISENDYHKKIIQIILIHYLKNRRWNNEVWNSTELFIKLQKDNFISIMEDNKFKKSY